MDKVPRIYWVGGWSETRSDWQEGVNRICSCSVCETKFGHPKSIELTKYINNTEQNVILILRPFYYHVLEGFSTGFGLQIGFTNHFNTWHVTTLNYSAITDLHILLITTVFQSAFISRFPVTDFKNADSSTTRTKSPTTDSQLNLSRL
jgi:hypothetical protein